MDEKKHNIPGELIKENVSIFQVLELFMLKSDDNGAYTCPWHPDKTASMKIMPKNPKLVHCFGCGKTSDAIGLYMALSGKQFHDALKEMSGIFLVEASNSGYAIYSRQREQKRIEDEKKRVEFEREFVFFCTICEFEKRYKKMIELGDGDMIEAVSKRLNLITMYIDNYLGIEGNEARLNRRVKQYKDWRNAHENVRGIEK